MAALRCIHSLVIRVKCAYIYIFFFLLPLTGEMVEWLRGIQCELLKKRKREHKRPLQAHYASQCHCTRDCERERVSFITMHSKSAVSGCCHSVEN